MRNSPVFDNIFARGIVTVNECLVCKAITSRTDDSYVVSLQVPTSPSASVSKTTFASLIRNSLQTQQKSSGFCKTCDSFKPCMQRKSVSTYCSVL